MISQLNNRSLLGSLLVAMIVLAGCAGTVKHMEAIEDEQTVFAPEAGKAMIVFMRPSGFGFGIQSSVFRVVVPAPDLAGIVAAKMKVAYQVNPGEHLFMVIGESADFMSAEVEGDKTYYALVTPRMGVWKARFLLKPVKRPDQNREQPDEWLEACYWAVETPEAEAWQPVT